MPQDIDLILPCFDPPAHFAELVNLYFSSLKACLPDRRLNLLVVNDGSRRNFTEIQIKQLSSVQESIQIVSYVCNRGKGYALRKAVGISRSPLVIYTDYDFPFKVESIVKLIEELDKDADIVLVSRNSDYLRILPLSRKFYSLMSRLLNRIFLGLKYTETQGGLKGFNLKGKEIFMSTTINEFLFDTEFIYRASLEKGVSIVRIEGRTREGLKPNKIDIRVIIRELINFYKITKIKSNDLA